MAKPHNVERGAYRVVLDALPLPLQECARGAVPCNVALLNLAMAAMHGHEVEEALVRALDAARCEAGAAEVLRLEEALSLWRDNPQAFATVKAVLTDLEHEGVGSSAEDGVSHWAAAFDRIARISPEGSVALYALGNPDLLQAATAEVVERLRAWRLVGPGRTVLDLGCGIGRFAEALAPQVEHVIGLDVSRVMIDRGRERCSHLANVTLQVSSGHDLSPVGRDRIDLILAADVFPYLVLAGTEAVEAHLREAARVLKPGGALLIFNYSYRSDARRDRDDLERLASAAGLDLVRAVCGDFTRWDAATFHIVKPS
jgi:SAM-dependent methyltransferase